MPSEPAVLAFDTSAAHCAAALFVEGEIFTSVQEMDRGQAEALMPMLDELINARGLTYRDLKRLAVGIGPGNFTGIRISVSAARGLSMGLDIPAIGISGFEALLYGQTSRSAAIPAPRDMAYLQHGGGPPFLIDRADVPKDAVWPRAPGAFVRNMVMVAAETGPDRLGPPPAPLYIRPADAAPSRDVPPVILDEPN